MRIENLKMVWLHEIAKEIANQIHTDPNDIAYAINCALTDRDDIVVEAYVPDDEDSMTLDYDIENELFYRIVMRECGLTYGDKFLVYTE